MKTMTAEEKDWMKEWAKDVDYVTGIVNKQAIAADKAVKNDLHRIMYSCMMKVIAERMLAKIEKRHKGSVRSAVRKIRDKLLKDLTKK